MQRRLLMVIILIAVTAAGWWLARRDGPKRGAAVVPADAATVAATRGGAPAVAAGARVKRVSPERRRDLAARIKAAQAAREARVARAAAAPSAGASGGATAAGGPAAEPAPMQTTEEVLHELLAILPELQAHVTECQAQHGPQVAGFKAKLTLTGDPEIGTVIDASELEGLEAAAPLPTAFDDCVRDRMQTLELPPMSTGTTFSASMAFDLTADDEDAER